MAPFALTTDWKLDRFPPSRQVTPPPGRAAQSTAHTAMIRLRLAVTPPFVVAACAVVWS